MSGASRADAVGRARPRIVVVHSSDELYGADRMLLEIVEALTTIVGAEVEVWLPSDLPHGPTPLCHELDRRGVAVRHLDLPILRRALLRPRGLLGLAAGTLRLRRELRRSRATAVHCATSACLLAAPAARLAGIRVVSLHVQEIWTGTEAHLLRLLARFTTLRLTISRSVDTAAKLRRSEVVENCVPGLDELLPGDDPAGRDGALHYVVASRWNAWKGHRTLLTAWARAGCPGRLTVLGGPPPSGERVDVAALVADLLGPSPDRTGTVEIVGEVADIGPFLDAADVLVLPSDQPEPFGLVMVEAFAHGRPVIASRAGGPLEVVTSGDDGWLYPLADADALAVLLRSLDRDQVALAATRARATFEARFTPQRYRLRIASLYTVALASGLGLG
jgi:glycosyltransferase involved in cell wall biosynthesis